MGTLSIIDIGSNTIHLLIVDIPSKDRFRILYEDKEHLRLGSELATNKVISNIKIADTLTILKKYISISNTFKASSIIAVATEALRSAENNHYILDLIKTKLGLPIKLLSSHEEAYLAFLGVKKTFNIPKGIIIDSGGASTEFIGVINNSFVTSASIPLGAINVTEKIHVDSNGKFIFCEYTQDYFNELFSKIRWINEFNNSTLIGIGGTLKNFRNIYNNLNVKSLPNNFITEMSLDELNSLCNFLKKLSLSERKALKGLSSKRGDIILGGCEIINNFVKYLNFDKIILSESGLRTGVLFHYMDIIFDHNIDKNKSIIS